MKKAIKILAVIISLLLIAAFIFRDKIYRLQFALKMFSGVEQVERFREIEKYFPTREILPSDAPSILKQGEPISLPSSYFFKIKSA